MVNMNKMKEEALRRKREHEKKELEKQMAASKAASKRSGRKRSHGSASGRRSNPSAQRALAQQQQLRPKKRKRSVSRWVLDILLVLGALLVIVIILSPFR